MREVPGYPRFHELPRKRQSPAESFFYFWSHPELPQSCTVLTVSATLHLPDTIELRFHTVTLGNLSCLYCWSKTGEGWFCNCQQHVLRRGSKGGNAPHTRNLRYFVEVCWILQTHMKCARFNAIKKCSFLVYMQNSYMFTVPLHGATEIALFWLQWHILTRTSREPNFPQQKAKGFSYSYSVQGP